MDFTLSEEQQMIVDSLGKYARNELEPIAREYRDRLIPKEAMLAIQKNLLDFGVGIGVGVVSEELGGMGLIDYVNSQFDRTVTWDDVAWLVDQWDGPFLIKGLQSVEDVKRAHEIGATGVMVSNHGGRQLEGAPAPVDCIPALREAVGNDRELIVDGGIRRGVHILKALALGADACSIGRPYLYGLAAGGQAGAERAIEILQTELERSMALLGVASINELESTHIRRVGASLHTSCDRS